MKRIIFSVLLLIATFVSANSVKAQDDNKITFMMLLNDAKQNFKVLKGDQFSQSEDGNKIYYGCLDGFNVSTEFITVENANSKQKSSYTLYFNLTKLSTDDMAPVLKIVEDAISFANLLDSSGKYKGEDVTDPNTNDVTTQLRDITTNNVVMEITSGNVDGSHLVMITFYGSDYW